MVDALTFLKKIKPAGLRFQLITGIASISVILMSLFVLQMINKQETFFLKLNHDRAIGLSVSLANTSNSYVISYELARLQKLVETYKEIPGLEYAMVTSDDGLVLSHSNEKYVGLKTTDSVSARLKHVNTTQILLENNSILDVTSPIINNNEIVGWARIGLSQKLIEPNLTEIRRKGLLYILISLIVGSIFAIIVAGRLTKGLRKLVIAAKGIKDGNRDIRVKPSKSLEISQLGTAFNQMLDEISAKEKLLSMVLENMPVGVFILDAKGNVLSLNPAGQKIWEGAKYVGKGEYNVYKGWFPDGKEIESHEWGAAVALTENRAVLNQEAEIEGFDGSRKTILNSCLPLHDADKKIVGIISINVDITDRKKAELAVKESEAKYRYLFNNNPAFVIIWDLESLQVKEVNDTVIDKYGYTREEWIDMSVLQYRHKEDHEKIKIFARNMLIEGNEPVAQMSWKHIKKNGEEMQMEISSHKIMYNNRPCILSLGNDVTERLKMEDKLRESQEQLSLFIEHSPASLAMFDTEMRYIATSRRWMNDYNLGNQNIIGKIHYEVFPEIGQEWKDIHKRCLKGAIERKEEDSFTRVDGKADWLKWEIRPWHKSSGEIGGIIMFTEVITERKNAEIKVEQSEEKNRALIENITDAIVLTDMSGSNIYRSPSVERITGYTDEDAKSMNMLDFIYEDDLKFAEESFKDSLRLPGIPSNFEVRIRHKKGNLVWIEGTNLNLLDNKSISALITNFREITERKKFEEQQALITSIVNSSNDAVISKTIDGIISSWNKGAERILGYSAQEIIGKPISLIIPPDLLSEEKEILSKIKMGISIDQYETQRRKKDGELIYVSLTISPIVDSTGKITGASKILHDTTYRKLMELEREKTITELIQRNRDLEQFSYIISHNVRAPLANIVGTVNLLKKLELTEAEKKRFITNIGISSNKLDEVLKDLNLILQVKHGINEKKETVNFSALLSEIQTILSVQLENVTLRHDFSLIDEIYSLKSYLRSIFYNLISNSTKYRRADVPLVIDIKSEVFENRIRLVFKDNGMGINLEKYGDTLFGMYQRFHLHTEGKGMGLYMVKTQVESLGGKISIQSQVNKGTEFIIEFEMETNKINRLS